jgi:(2Fe-2S) ferredoxin
MGNRYLKFSEFDLEGEFLGFVSNQSRKFKFIQFGLAKCNASAGFTAGNIKIKLPKELRKVLSLALSLGDRIRVVGCSKLHPLTGKIKFKAYDVTALPLCSIQKLPLQPSILSEGNNSQPACLPKAKILVCQGSGCRKRGAKSLLSKIEKSLSKGKASKEALGRVQKQVKIQSTGCIKKCSNAPNCIVQVGKKKYSQMKPDAIASLLEDHLS